MSNAAVIPDEQVKDCAGKPAPESKPGNVGYASPVPDKNDELSRKDKPCLKVELVNEDSKEPKKVSKLTLQGNVGRVTVEGKEKGSKNPKTILEDTPVPEDGTISLPTSEELEEVTVIFEAPKTDDENEYKSVLSIFACGHFPGRFSASTPCQRNNGLLA